jgi:hypothetical protein
MRSDDNRESSPAEFTPAVFIPAELPNTVSRENSQRRVLR